MSLTAPTLPAYFLTSPRYPWPALKSKSPIVPVLVPTMTCCVSVTGARAVLATSSLSQVSSVTGLRLPVLVSYSLTWPCLVLTQTVDADVHPRSEIQTGCLRHSMSSPTFLLLNTGSSILFRSQSWSSTSLPATPTMFLVNVFCLILVTSFPTPSLTLCFSLSSSSRSFLLSFFPMRLTSLWTASMLGFFSSAVHAVTTPLCAAVMMVPSWRQIPTRLPEPFLASMLCEKDLNWTSYTLTV